MREQLEKLCNDFSNVSQLLSVMEKGAWEYANITACNDDADKPTEFFQELSYALAFVSDALKQKADVLWSIVEDIPEEDPDESGGY